MSFARTFAACVLKGWPAPALLPLPLEDELRRRPTREPARDSPPPPPLPISPLPPSPPPLSLSSGDPTGALFFWKTKVRRVAPEALAPLLARRSSGPPSLPPPPSPPLPPPLPAARVGTKEAALAFPSFPWL